MGNFIELVFHRFFLGMIATAYFWLLTLAGGVVFGIAPASATLMSLFAEHGYSYRSYRFKEAWTLYKSNFINLSFICSMYILAEKKNTGRTNSCIPKIT